MRFPVPRVYLGTMTFGWAGQTSSVVDESVALEIVKHFICYNTFTNVKDGGTPHRIDTARVYAGGKTEHILGTVFREFPHLYEVKPNVQIGTKAHPSQPLGLSPTGMRNQLKASLEAMELSSVEEFYLHQPDTENALLDSLKCAHELVQEGLVRRIGMSNYHATEMERSFALCEEHKLTKPVVYQGLYNPLNRMVESDLIPILKQNGCTFVAYNPLAAGMLAGKHKRDQGVQEGRFKDNPNYLPRFYTQPNFEAIELIQEACRKESLSMVEATFRWLLRHSALDEKDGMLLGASSTKQLLQNLSACGVAEENGPLPQTLIDAFDDAWKITSDTAFPYWRSYSSDMPGREALDQGASYSVKKKY